MSDGQVKHHWIDWNEMAEDHIRVFTDRDDTWSPRTLAPQLIHKILRVDQTNGRKAVETKYLVEFQEPLTPGKYPNGRVAQSYAKFAFPKLHFPRWKRAGGSMVAVRRPGLGRWFDDSLLTPVLGIKTNELIYITTDDPDDFALIKMRCEEYRGT